uniref:hypothetical protein n=1 Tax=Rhodococcus qingshengii TaxID=334542 RepID=UPI001C4E025F|nr:hypothetical protein [Rhodococcus qingshengii]
MAPTPPVSPMVRKSARSDGLRVHTLDIGVRSSWRDTADLVVEQQLARARRVALTERPYAQAWREYLLSIGGKDREFLDLIESASQQLITK